MAAVLEGSRISEDKLSAGEIDLTELAIGLLVGSKKLNEAVGAARN